MSWSSIFSRQAEPGASRACSSSRIFIYLALAVISLLLTYQLVLNHDAVGALAPWRSGHSDPQAEAVNGWAGSALNGTLQEAIDQVAKPSSSPTSSVELEPTPSSILSAPTSISTPTETPEPESSITNDLSGPSNITRELVLAAMMRSDMSWVDENVPGWKTNIYRADAAEGEAEFTVPANKGNEAMVFLTYIIDRYDSLPDVMVFMHGGRYQWHNDNPLYDSVISIKDLQLDHVRKTGYVNLRCAWPIGCPAELEPARYFRERPDDPNHPTAVEFPDRFMELFPGEELPEVIGVPCCSQFALSAEAVRARGREDYVRMRKWLLESTLDSATSGRIFEYAWHIMFGKESQYCLDVEQCYCNTYGYCNMSPDELSTQWTFIGLTLPEGWPDHPPRA